MKTKKELFAKWLSANVASGRLSDYFVAIADVEAFAKRKKLLTGSIYDVSNPLAIAKIIDAINSDRIFRFTHKKQMKYILNVAWLFHRYTRENKRRQSDVSSAATVTKDLEETVQSQVEDAISVPKLSGVNPSPDITREDTYENLEIRYQKDVEQRAPDAVEAPKQDVPVETKDETVVVTHPTPKCFATTRGIVQSKKHPCQIGFEAWMIENNTPEGSAHTYSKAVKRIGDYLLENQREERHIFSIFGIPRLERILEEFKNDRNYTDSAGSKDSFLDFYALRKYIAFRKNDTSETVNDALFNRYSTLLEENFENGFRINSVIDRNRFKQYYFDLYGKEIQQNEEEMLAIIEQAGELQDGRVFARSGGRRSDLLDDIQADIAKTFKQGASCIYISSVFEKYQNDLASQLQIYSEDVLCEQLLSTCYGSYQMEKQYFFIRGRNPDAASDVQKIMKQSQLPLNYGQIHGILWYIPVDQIKHCLVITDGVVNVAKETYFYAFNLPVSTDELEQIAGLIQDQLSQKSFITDDELREMIKGNCPSVAINTESFTTWGLRNALAVLLRNRFSFKGAIISPKNMNRSAKRAFVDLCTQSERVTVDELQTLARDLGTRIYWEPVYQYMVRIDRDTFVSRDQISFDVERTDAVLDDLISGDFVPVKSVELFLLFPVIEVSWNSFVLESYVARYSRKFRLVHPCFQAGDCCGAIVRRTSHIKDFKTLVVDALSRSSRWKTEEDALALLVESGYLQRRRYSEIEFAMAEARQLREKPVKQGE